jgi:hypothetical protein
VKLVSQSLWPSTVLDGIGPKERPSRAPNRLSPYLISYPDHETIKQISTFLRNPTKQRLNDALDSSGKPISKVEVFQLRQSAYLALIFLGARPQKPEGFSPDWSSRHFATGFESRTYFPYVSGSAQRSDQKRGATTPVANRSARPRSSRQFATCYPRSPYGFQSVVDYTPPRMALADSGRLARQ